MNPFKVHSIESAPEAAKESLKQSQEAFGMLPNLHAVMAESPAVLEAYKTLHGLFSTQTSFNTEEQTVIWQTINVSNECHYCIPAHTAIAHMSGVDAGITEALRNETPLADAKLQALRDTTLAIINNRGNLSAAELENFTSAGYSNKHLLEIVLGYSQKIMSNYTNHFAKTPVDEPFQKFAWSRQTA